MRLEDLRPGDVVRYENGGCDYLVSVSGERGLWVNACSGSWMARGLREYCQEVYPFTKSDAERVAEVVEHHEDGTASGARKWWSERGHTLAD